MPDIDVVFRYDSSVAALLTLRLCEAGDVLKVSRESSHLRNTKSTARLCSSPCSRRVIGSCSLGDAPTAANAKVFNMQRKRKLNKRSALPRRHAAGADLRDWTTEGLVKNERETRQPIAFFNGCNVWPCESVLGRGKSIIERAQTNRVELQLLSTGQSVRFAVGRLKVSLLRRIYSNQWVWHGWRREVGDAWRETERFADSRLVFSSPSLSPDTFVRVRH